MVEFERYLPETKFGLELVITDNLLFNFFKITYSVA
jgi:hypothetical protein